MSEPTVMIYQIGNLPIHLHDQLWSSDEFKSDGKAVDLPGSYKTLWPDLQFQPAMRTTQLSGILVGSCGFPPARTAQLLKRLVGHPVPIIGWWDDGCCDGLCPCECNSKGCTAVWVENYGIIRSVTLSNKKTGVADIAINVEMGGYWQPLDRKMWVWSNAFTANPTEYPCIDDPFADPTQPWGVIFPPVERTDYWQYFSPYPRCDMLFNRHCNCEGFFYRGLSEYTMLNPKIWPYDVKYHAPGYPTTGFAVEPTTLGYSTSVSDHHEFLIDSGKWGAPPLSLYSFTSIVEPLGVASIRIERPDGLYGNKVEWTKLDLVELNQSMIDAGWGSLRPTDQIIIGDIDRMPGVIIRNKMILDNVRPLPTFEGQWPGYMEPGRIDITVSLVSGGVYAMKHEWRRL